jgi:hypothetical protein
MTIISTYFVREATEGVTPVNSNNWRYLESLRAPLAAEISDVQSRMQSGNRRPASKYSTSLAGSGTIEVEYSILPSLEFLECLLGNVFGGGNSIIQGQNKYTNSIEQHYLFDDASFCFMLFKAAVIDSLSLRVPFGQLVTASWGLKGASPEYLDGTTDVSKVGSGSIQAAYPHVPLNGSVDAVSHSVDAGTLDVRDMTFTFNNKARPITSWGFAGPRKYELSQRPDIGGSLECFVEKRSVSLFKKTVANTPIDISFRLQDATNWIEFSMPACIPVTTPPGPGDADEDRIQTIQFSMDSTDDLTITKGAV